jgi:hypothetical protein
MLEVVFRGDMQPTKGHFTLRPSVKRTKDSNNLIGEE